MDHETLLKRLISLVDDINPTNVHQTICSFYDIHNQLTFDILKSMADNFNLNSPPSEPAANMPPQKYLTACLPFIMFLFNSNRHEELRDFIEKVASYLETCDIPRQYDRLYAKIYFFYSISATDPLQTLLAAYRRSCDLHFHQAQATIVNCILKHYIDVGGYNLALSFLRHCKFPSDASPAQLGRYHFLYGHLKAVTLEYADAQHNLQLSLRRAPQNRHAESFRSLVTRHLMVVMMLQGQVPSRAMLLDQPNYLDLARSILQGDVIAFQKIAQNQQFIDDGLAPLVQRLRSAVILAGLTMISHCYSRITFNNIAEMLHIGSAEDAEGFCAKAAADGLIDALIDHESGCLISQQSKDDSAAGFSERIHKDIQDCFGIREDTQRTMHDEAVSE
ncbi:PCI domain containing protein [Tritrichomonas foetus]|uniref:PCI domain containing protein n=1 Tax=Tritrichomonas foetus TaxID=1144522 RepID=A0A1J4J3C2_9EUKA|nr:PCI domain containing protein [Tritrichomonas foetus]|eukprot:OHS93858.1 PCI domain containing protein [Tritrichomonas foetus]